MRLGIAVLGLVIGCGSTGEATGPAASPHKAPPTVAGAAPRAWKLTLSSDYGPCSEDDPRPCHRRWSATSAGIVTQTDLPNSPKREEATTTRQLSPADRAALDALLALPEVVAGMAHGFPCQGPAHDPDATLQLTLQLAPGSATQYVERCTRGGVNGSGDPANVVNQILRLLGR